MTLFNKQLFKTLIYWMNEREEMRIQKEYGAPTPWSDDPLMTKWRWCNVNRCHDRETRWIFKNIIEKNADSKTLWFNLCIARFINWSETLDHIGYFHRWQPEVFSDVMKYRMKDGLKNYTGAYMIRAGTGVDAKMPKHEYLVKRVFTPLWERRKHIPEYKYADNRCADWDAFLSNIFGMGDFMRNQIITDMKYAPNILPKNYTKDWNTFCLAGPGTRRGLNRLLGWPIDKAHSKYEIQRSLVCLRDDVIEEVDFHEYFVDLNNLANCLCEFDKYMRLKNKEGEPRSHYKPSPVPLP